MLMMPRNYCCISKVSSNSFCDLFMYLFMCTPCLLQVLKFEEPRTFYERNF